MTLLEQPLELWMFLVVNSCGYAEFVKIWDGTLVVTYQQTKELCLFDENFTGKKNMVKIPLFIISSFYTSWNKSRRFIVLNSKPTPTALKNRRL
jgi:hypothetical protein